MSAIDSGGYFLLTLATRTGGLYRQNPEFFLSPGYE